METGTKKSIWSANNAATDDYATRRAPKSWSWSYWQIMMPITGGGTASLWLAYGGIFGSTYGMKNIVVALVICTVVQTLVGMVLANIASKYRMGSDLATRGLGLGFNGSVITNIIYAFEWLYFWAVETQILGAGISAGFGIPEQVGWVIVGIGIFVPITIFGMKFITKFQNWTIPVFLIWFAINVIIVLRNPEYFSNVRGLWTFMPEGMYFGALPVAKVLNAFIASALIVPLLTMEFVRGVRASDSQEKRRRGLFAVVFIPQNAWCWLIYLPIGALLWKATGALNPGDVFVELTGMFGVLGLLLTQIRINVQNTYAESLALSSLASKLHINLGRSVWSIIACIVGTILVFLDIFAHIETIATVVGFILSSWIAMLLADYLVVRKKWNLPTGEIEHRRAYLKSLNKVGFTSLLSGSCLGAILLIAGRAGVITGMAGEWVAALTSIIAFVTAFCVHLIVAKALAKPGSNPYLARTPEEFPEELLTLNGGEEFACSHCESIIGPEDAAKCPEAGGAWICSACCSGNKTCNTACQRSTGQSKS